MSESDKRQVRDSVKTTLNNYFKDIRTSGLMAEFKYLDSSNEFFWVPPRYSGPISYDSVAAILKEKAPLFREINNTFEYLNIIPITRTRASYSGRIRSVMTDSSGLISEYFLLETGTMVKRNSGWKLLSGQTSMAAE